MTPECILCQQEFPDWQDLAEHLCREHQLFTVNDWKNYIFLEEHDHGQAVECWCGWQNAKREGLCEFAQHLKEHGGMAAHVLECTLGA